jgi:DNA polymerase III delta subunit
MLRLFSGTDREKARSAMQAVIKKISKKEMRIVRVSDANTVADLASVLRGGGMFAEPRTVIFDGVLANDDMREILLAELPALRASSESFFILEEKPDAATRKQVEKYAETSERFDAAKSEKEDNFFAVTNAFRARKKKELWILLQREYAAGKPPEMVHGILFWAAKQMILKPRAASDTARGRKLVAELAELPHESRRKGIELEYALERFVLSRM